MKQSKSTDSQIHALLADFNVGDDITPHASNPESS